jgi:hypothetical protein
MLRLLLLVPPSEAPVSPASGAPSDAAALSSAIEKWECPGCTFQNSIDRTRCELCETDREPKQPQDTISASIPLPAPTSVPASVASESDAAKADAAKRSSYYHFASTPKEQVFATTLSSLTSKSVY